MNEIPVTDFRIGNFAQDQNGNLLKVVGLNETDIEFSVVDRSKFPLPDGWQAEAIEITEDWVLKLGFEKCEGRHGIYYKHCEMDLLRVWTAASAVCDCGSWAIGGKDIEFASPDRKYNTHWINMKLKYIHQLQNIFYALTESDLQLNNVSYE